MSVFVIAAVAATLISAASQSADETADETGYAMVRLLAHHAATAKRERLVRGSLGASLSGLQLGLGIYGQVELGDDTGMRRAAVGQIVAGSVGVVNGLVQIAVPSPIERLQRSPVAVRVAQAPGDAEAVVALRHTWAEAAKSAKRRRRISGGLTLGLGAVIGAMAFVRLADATGSERQWAFTTVTSSLGLVSGGIAALVLPSEDERSYAAFEASRPRGPVVRVGPTVGGVSFSGRF